MRFLSFSDTHGYHGKLYYPEADVLLFGGDWTRGSSKYPVETIHFADFLHRLPHKHKIVVAGNHDWYARLELADTRKIFEDRGIVFLCDAGCRVTEGEESYSIWGSPWTPKFYNWAFMKNRNSPELKECWGRVPEETDILITHGPPYGVLDQNVRDGEHCGCELLKDEIKRIKPLVHVFGHIHEGYGVWPPMPIKKASYSVNASVWDHYNHSFRQPIVFDIEDGQVKFVW